MKFPCCCCDENTGNTQHNIEAATATVSKNNSSNGVSITVEPKSKERAGNTFIKDQVNNKYASATEYLNEIQAEIKAEFSHPYCLDHVGNYIVKGLTKFKTRTNQIEADSGVSETNEQVYNRTIDLARAFINYGLTINDVIVIIAPNHLDVVIPVYACFLVATPFLGLDRRLGYAELSHLLNIVKPKLLFCQTSSADLLEKIKSPEVNFEIVTFDENKYSRNITFKAFIEKYNKETESREKFKPRVYDDEYHSAFLCATSGSTGLPKAAMVSHKAFTAALSMRVKMVQSKIYPDDNMLLLQLSPLQWITSVLFASCSGMFGWPRVQTVRDYDVEHIYDIINKYRPTATACSPAMAFSLLKNPTRVDLTCFEVIFTTGSHSSDENQEKLHDLIGRKAITHQYGSTEICGAVFIKMPGTPVSLVGKPLPFISCKIVDPNTGVDCPPGVAGELWVKGPVVFKGYYNMPNDTRDAFSDDGWFKSGDLMIRNEEDLFFFVDRMKSTFKYNSIQVSPAEIEGVLQTLKGVKEVACVGIPEDNYNFIPAVMIVKEEGCDLNEERVHQFVKETLSDAKQLRGGILFTNKIPMTTTHKIDRKRVKEILTDFYNKNINKTN